MCGHFGPVPCGLRAGTGPRRGRRAGRPRALPAPQARGQATIEAALVLPVLILVVAMAVQLLGYAYARAMVGNLADRAALDVGLAGGETASVDAQLARACAGANLDCSQLQVRISTSAPGLWPAVNAADPSDWPAPATAGTAVTVELSYNDAFVMPGVTHYILIHVTQSGIAVSARTPGPPQ